MGHQSPYSSLQIWLHWLVALMLAITWFLGNGMGRALRQRMETGATGIEGNTWHVWCGGIVFLLVLIRIAVRLGQGAPEPEPGAPRWQTQSALWGHRALHLMMVVVPTLGAITWYGRLPAVGDWHQIAVNVLLVLVAGHTLLALYHQYIARDRTLTRMIPFLK